MRKNSGPVNLLIILEAGILVLVLILGFVLKNPFSGRIKSEGKQEQAEQQADMDNGEKVEQENTDSQQAPDTEIQEPSDFSEDVARQLTEMSLEAKVAQLFLVSPETLTGEDEVTIAGNGTEKSLERHPIGGVVYSKTNYKSEQQFTEMISGIETMGKEKTGQYLLLAVFGAGEEGDITLIADTYDAAPLNSQLSKDKIAAGDYIIAPAAFPSETEIGADVPFVMTEHKTADELTGEAGSFCSVSEGAGKYLRNSLGYSGLIMTADLSQDSVKSAYPDGEAAVKAVCAGADLLYQSSDYEKAYDAVLKAAQDGTIPEERINNAVGHILTYKAGIQAPSQS